MSFPRCLVRRDARRKDSRLKLRYEVGSVGFFGPMTVRPDLQERGIAQALLAKTMEQFDDWGTRHVGLFTFAQSAKHVGLYQKYGFYARFLTAIMSSPVAPRQSPDGWLRFG